MFLCDSRQVSQHTTKRWQQKKKLEHSSALPSTLLSSSNPAHLLKLNRSHRACLSAWRTLSGLSGGFQLQLQHNNHRRGEYSYSLRRRKEWGGKSVKEKDTRQWRRVHTKEVGGWEDGWGMKEWRAQVRSEEERGERLEESLDGEKIQCEPIIWWKCYVDMWVKYNPQCVQYITFISCLTNSTKEHLSSLI